MIAIRVVSRAGEAPAVPLAAHFGEGGGDIGRGGDCTLVLPDPERRISRKHLQVAYRAGRPALRLLSTNLLVELNGAPLSPGIEYLLDDRSLIRIGPFVLETRVDASAAAASRGADVLDLLSAPRLAARPSVFEDLLQSQPRATPRDSAGEVDLLIGDTASARRVPAAEVEQAVAALYAGLGIPPAAACGSAEQARLIGALLRAMVSGTLGLLASRAIAKRELGAGLTVPQTRKNNPLKFASDVDGALALLLGAPQPGFVAPLDAVAAAFDDLRAHELALLAGMRAALESVLARFDPQAFESQLAGKGVWDNLVPANHKARLWERFNEQHAQLMHEIEEDFDSVFGRAFLDAYEAQFARLSRGSADAPGGTR